MFVGELMDLLQYTLDWAGCCQVHHPTVTLINAL